MQQVEILLTQLRHSKKNSHPQTAIVRGLKEELGIILEMQTITSQIPGESTELSPSYPGLTCQYKYFPFQVTIPEDAYKCNGYIEDDGKKYTYFAWQDVK